MNPAVEHTVYLGLGSNLGEREGNLRQALRAMAAFVRLQAVSRVYQSAPWGYTTQPAFLNAAARVSTALSALDLLQHLKGLEEKLGRQPSFRYGPRLIDLDILFYDALVLETPGLTIPHPRLHERAFVLIPLADLAPELVHPRLGVSVQQLLQELAPAEAAGVQATDVCLEEEAG